MIFEYIRPNSCSMNHALNSIKVLDCDAYQPETTNEPTTEQSTEPVTEPTTEPTTSVIPTTEPATTHTLSLSG